MGRTVPSYRIALEFAREDGWQKYDEIQLNGVIYHCYKKPKRFGCLKKDKPQNYVDKSQNSGDSLICK